MGGRLYRRVCDEELSHGSRGERDLGGAEVDVPVDVVFEDYGGFEARGEEPG